MGHSTHRPPNRPNSALQAQSSSERRASTGRRKLTMRTPPSPAPHACTHAQDRPQCRGGGPTSRGTTRYHDTRGSGLEKRVDPRGRERSKCVSAGFAGLWPHPGGSRRWEYSDYGRPRLSLVLPNRATARPCGGCCASGGAACRSRRPLYPLTGSPGAVGTLTEWLR